MRILFDAENTSSVDTSLQSTGRSREPSSPRYLPPTGKVEQPEELSPVSPTRLDATDNPRRHHVVERRSSWFQRFARHRALDWLSKIQWGTIEFTEAAAGDGAEFCFSSPNGPRCRLSVKSPKFYSSVAAKGATGLAESYMQGHWQTDNLPGLLRILYRHGEGSSQYRSLFAKLLQRTARFCENALGNTISRSRRQTAAHYDLSNEFFEMFLDPTLMYSSAYFDHPEMSLEQASHAKLKQVCRKLQLKPGEHVLEIGTGWGGFALHCVEQHDVCLTTTTISQQQYQKAQKRFAAAKCTDRIELLSQDYRLLSGTYDKLVSIEMIEAVGERNLDSFFRQCGQLLKPGGRMVIQAIVMPEQRFDEYRRRVDFIQKYIFPGGFLPSIAAIQQSVARTTNLRLNGIEDLSPHYARTIREWTSRFRERLGDVIRLGFDKRFVRMWEFYLCYCEAAFCEQAVQVVQIVWDRPPR